MLKLLNNWELLVEKDSGLYLLEKFRIGNDGARIRTDGMYCRSFAEAIKRVKDEYIKTQIKNRDLNLDDMEQILNHLDETLGKILKHVE